MPDKSAGLGVALEGNGAEVHLSQEQELRAKRLHKQALIVDGTALAYTLEPPFTQRLLEAGVGGIIVTAFIGVEIGRGSHTELALRALDRAHRRIASSEGLLQLALTVEDVASARSAGRLAVFLGFQNATPLGDDTKLVDVFHRIGVRCIQLTYNLRNLLGDGCLEPRGGGLSLLGIDMLHAMQERGIAVDLSHVGDATVEHALEIARKPVAFTHANPRSVCNNPRNKTDEHIARCSSAGGVTGLVAFPAFVRHDGRRPRLTDLLDHADRVKQVGGSSAMSIGLDFIEGWSDREKQNLTAHPSAFGSTYDFPCGLESVAQLPNLTRGFVARGYSDQEILGILGGNLLAFLDRAWS